MAVAETALAVGNLISGAFKPASGGRSFESRNPANNDDVIALSATPANIARMWLSGRVKVQASMRDLLALRKLL